MEERIQNLLTSLEAIKSNPALDTQEYQMKPEEKSKITVELKAIQADLLKAIDEFAVSFNIDLESSNITEQPQEPQEQPQEEPQEQPPTQLDQPPTQLDQPPTQLDQTRPEAQLEPGTTEDMYTGEDFDDEEDDEDDQQDELGGGNKKQKTKKNKHRSQKTTQKNKKKN